MLICTKCKKELACVKNGVGLDYGAGCIHASDLYACPVCGVSIAKANDNGHVDYDHTMSDQYIDMTAPRVTALDALNAEMPARCLPGGFTNPDDEAITDRLTLVAAVDAMIDAMRYFDTLHWPTEISVYAGLIANAVTLGDECGYDWTEDQWPVGLTAALLAREDGA